MIVKTSEQMKEAKQWDLENINLVLELIDREIQLRKDIFDAQAKNPKVLKPNFGFEEGKEYEELRVKQWQLDLDKAVQKLNEVRKQNEVIKEQIIDEMKEGE